MPVKNPLKAPAKGVNVRMYRHGLGDCFLLAFPATGVKKSYYVMIDCGVILGTPNPEAKMKAVMQDICEVTGGEIDLLVITHEHWDHLSGFIQAAPKTADFQIKNLWFAWTEDPTDPVARELRKQFQNALNALHLAVSRAKNNSSLKATSEVLSFFGEELGVTGKKTTTAALQTVRDLVKPGGKVNYLRPGDGPLGLPDNKKDGVRIFVLGPPLDVSALKKVNPTAKGKETYSEKGALAAVADRMSQALAEGDAGEVFQPFEQRLRIPLNPFPADPFFEGYYGNGEGQAESWRRIDDDWLGGAEELALKLDSYTNNTSVVLAFEFTASGKVLLFVADAQVGNWLSWEPLSWKVKNGAKTETVKSADLLKRTVLYKVGHHGSHNATMREAGLERMASDELISLVPVDADVAHNIKGWTKMPFLPLLDRLGQKCHGRVIRSDKGLPKKPKDVSAADWKKFTDAVSNNDLFVDLTIRG